MHRFLAAAIAAALIAGCTSSEKPQQTRNTYNATASVGDFLIITIDSVAKTIDYDNRTTQETGTVSYTVAADGSYLITDPDGKLITAYEIPGLALVMQGEHFGPNGDEKTLIVALQKAILTKADLAGKEFNFLQFRTTEGGMEMGSAEGAADGSGDIFLSNYRPANPLYLDEGGDPRSPYVADTLPGAWLVEDADLGVIEARIPDEVPSLAFGTPGGHLAIDTANGSIIGWRKAASKAFDPAHAGTYKAIYYAKTADVNGAGTPQTGTATVTLSTSGHIRVKEADGTTTMDTDLIPFADSDLYGLNRITKPCHGMFVFDNGSGELTFAVFMDQAMAFASFKDMSGASVSYHYSYGFALKQ
jgi:hypothetical protein